MINDFYRLRGPLPVISNQIRAFILAFNQHETGACAVADDPFIHRPMRNARGVYQHPNRESGEQA
ncbi:hypothetical protein [Caballeronia ptereochthonis]|uniref:hypothetical protein n=1 Tax=Caballeronia ptereochthonis TaxID=1777144 RepID=UPI000ADE0557|nr:hypothetical protein [Caballeronia ptereochthonis]